MSEGSVLMEGTRVVHSVVGPCVLIGRGCSIESSILLGQPEIHQLHGSGVPDVGDGCVLRNCVVGTDACARHIIHHMYHNQRCGGLRNPSISRSPKFSTSYKASFVEQASLHRMTWRALTF
jgi:hypothetical protein